MAVSLLLNEVSDLCIGKPPLRSLPLSAATVSDALVALKRGGEPHLAVLDSDQAPPGKKAVAVAGKICVADILCFLCSDDNLASPAAALERPVTALLPKGAGLVRLVEPQFSVLEALDLFVDGAQNLVIPIRSLGRKKLDQGGDGVATAAKFCWLTHEDFVRYFLNSISLFCPIPTLSIDDLGLVQSADALTIRHDEPGLSLLPLVRRALTEQAAVAVVTDDGQLLGDISPCALSAGYNTVAVAAGIATLKAGDLMTFIDHYGSPPESLVRAIKAGLKEKGLQEMLHLMEDELSSFSNWSSASSSDDESSEEEKRLRRPSKSFSGTGRRSSEPEVCHPGSSLVAVMVQALVHRVSYLWVVDEEDYGLIGIVTFADMLCFFREQLQPSL